MSTNAVARTVRSLSLTDSSFVVSNREGSGSRSFRSIWSSAMMFSISSSTPELPSLSKPGGLARKRSIAGLRRSTMGLPCSAIRLAWRMPPFSHAVERVVEHGLRPAQFATSLGTMRSSSLSVLVSMMLSAWTARRWPDVWTPA